MEDLRSEVAFDAKAVRDSYEYLDALAQDYLSYAPGFPLQDWRKPPRPKSASYMRPMCRVSPDGSGGAPLQRPSSAPSGRHRSKTERWRESGMRRWPKEADKISHTRTMHPGEVPDGDPLRRHIEVPQQPDWTGELWVRSLRRPGVEIQDPAYHDVAQRGMRDLHEQWQVQTPRRPHSARAGGSRFTRPYCGATATGKVALPRKHDSKDWVLRPVATGKMSMKHFEGKRYAFNQDPRYLEWEEYVRTIEPGDT